MFNQEKVEEIEEIEDQEIQELLKLKEEKDAVILAHYYVNPTVQKIADHTGDSFHLAKVAQKLNNQNVIMAGVYFMAESVKILSPEKRVFMPDVKSDCPMAHMVTPEKIREMRNKYDDLAVVTYINSTAEIKAHSDVCVTSSNAVNIVNRLEEKNIFFVPDKNLGSYVAKKIKDKNIILNDGYCPVHNKVRLSDIEDCEACPGKARILVHPECRKEIVEKADYVGSTKGIIENVSKFPESDILIILTERGIETELKNRFPDRHFVFLKDFICPDMKLGNIGKIKEILTDPFVANSKEITVDPKIAEKAIIPLNRMLELGK